MAAVAALRKVTAQLSLVRSFSPFVIRDVLDEYPEFYTELGALAILRQLLLWSKIGKIDTARRIAETYPILIRSAPFVVNAFRKHGVVPGRDIDADGMLPDEDGAATPNAGTLDEQRLISRHQLASALMQAGSGPGASAALAEALARMDSLDEQHAAIEAAAGPSTSTSNPSASSTLTADPNAADSSARITSQAFNNAMRGAYRSTAYRTPPLSAAARTLDPNVPFDGAVAAAAAAASNIPAGQESARDRYRAELMIMREMGLTDDVQNVSALIVCNGNVEGAIDLVLSGLA